MENSNDPRSDSCTESAEASTRHPECNARVNVGDPERLISAAAGGFALLYGLSRLSLSGIVAFVAGGALLYRGVTGHCNLYEALEVSSVDEPAGHLRSRSRAARRATDASLAATGETEQHSSRPPR